MRKKKKMKKRKKRKKRKLKSGKGRNRPNSICSTSANFDFGQFRLRPFFFDFGQFRLRPAGRSRIGRSRASSSRGVSGGVSGGSGPLRVRPRTVGPRRVVPEGLGPKGGPPEGRGPEVWRPRRRWGGQPRKNGDLKGGAQKGGRSPKFRGFFPLPPQFSFFLPSLGCLLVEFAGCF